MIIFNNIDFFQFYLGQILLLKCWISLFCRFHTEYMYLLLIVSVNF